MKHISEVINKDLGLNRENSSLLSEKIKVFKILTKYLGHKKYTIENAYTKNNILYIECRCAEETEVLRYDEQEIREILVRENIHPKKMKFQTTIKN